MSESSRAFHWPKDPGIAAQGRQRWSTGYKMGKRGKGI